MGVLGGQAMATSFALGQQWLATVEHVRPVTAQEPDAPVPLPPAEPRLPFPPSQPPRPAPPPDPVRHLCASRAP